MTLDLQPYNENNDELYLQPVEEQSSQYQALPSKFKGSIIPTPEYTILDNIQKALYNISQIPVHAWKQGSSNVRTGELNFKLIHDGLDELEQSELNELENRTPFNYGVRPNSGVFNDNAYTIPSVQNLPERVKNSMTTAIGVSTESYPFSWEIAKDGGIAGVAGFGLGTVGGGVLGFAKGGFSGALENAKAGAMLGAKIGGGAGATRKSFELESGLAYQELKGMKDDDGNVIDTELAKKLAYGVGAVNAGLEMAGAIAELSTIPGADKLLKVAKIEAIKNIVKDKALSAKFIQAGSKMLAEHFAEDASENLIDKATKDNVRRLTKAVATEMTTEMLQETSNIFATEWAKQIQGNYSDALFSEDGVNSNTFKQHLARVVEAGAMAFIPAMSIGGIGTSATAVNIARQKAKMAGLDENKAAEIINQMNYNEKVEFINNNEDTLMELADSQLSKEKLNQIQDDSFNKMVEAGLNEEQAFSNAKLIGAMAKSFNNVDKAQEWINSLTFVSDKVLQGGIEMNVNSDDLTVHGQSAMHKDETSNNISEYYDKVNSGGQEYKNTKYTIQNKKLSIPADVINHSINKHNMTAEQWQDVTKNIDNIFIASVDNKSNSYSNNNYKIGIKTLKGDFYGAVIGTTKFDNYICTAFKSTENGIKSFVINKGKTPSKVLTESTQNESSIVAPLSPESNNIITDIKEKLNPIKVQYQTAQTAGAGKGQEADAVKEWKEKGTESKYFKNWFRDSKVVDENGKPLVVYHGTEHNFKIFKDTGKSRKIGARIGFLFTSNANMAKEYAFDKKVMPVYLNIKNPIVIEPNSTINIFGQDIEIKDTFDFFTQLDTIKSEQEIKQELLNQGYDGIILKNTNVDTPFQKDIHDVFVTLDNKQIKSVNNQGTFDSKNPNIYYQFAGEDAKTANKFELQNAKKMLEKGISPEEVGRKTGWFKGVDGKFRFEISDNEAKLKNIDKLKIQRNEDIDFANSSIDKFNAEMSSLCDDRDKNKISEDEFRKLYDKAMEQKLQAVDYLKQAERSTGVRFLNNILEHEKLFAAYPALKNIFVEFKSLGEGVSGAFSEVQQTIDLSISLLNDENKCLDTLMHEIQHFIQAREGFARGGSPEKVLRKIFDIVYNIENSDVAKEYNQLCKDRSLIYNAIDFKKIYDKPEYITKTYWFAKHGQGWFAPKKRSKARSGFVSGCIERYINDTRMYYDDRNLIEKFDECLKLNKTELIKKEKQLERKIEKLLNNIDLRTVSDFKALLKKVENNEIEREEIYRRLAGEVEARFTVNRRELTDAQRKTFHKSWNAINNSDTPNDYQIVVFSDGTKAYSKTLSNNNVETEFGEAQSELENNFRVDIENTLKKNDIQEDEFTIEDIKIYGSSTKGKNKDTSDLDVLIQYKGSMREDDAFNMFHDTDIKITDKKGIERVVDFNPINSEISGTIEEHINYMNSLAEQDGKVYYQSADGMQADSENIANKYDYIHNQKTGEKINIETNNDIKVDEIEPVVISEKLPFEISKKTAENKKKHKECA